MEGQKLALGLILVLIASGCAEMTGDASNSSSFDSLGLTVEEVENVTNSEYKASGSVTSSNVYTVNISNVARRVDSMFLKEENLSEAPDSVRSMVVALNGSEPGSLEKEENISSVTVDGYEAQRIEEANRTTLYGQEGNISFFVQSEGDGGIYRSTRELYKKMAEEIEKFEQ